MRSSCRYNIVAGLLWLIAGALSSCSTIWDGGPFCNTNLQSVNYRLKLLADVNLEDEDVFNEQITSIWVFAFDSNNTYVWSSYSKKEEIQTEDGVHYMLLEGLPAGDYHIVIWGGLGDDSSFSVPNLVIGSSQLNELTCTLARKTRGDETDIVDTDITSLFHGMTNLTIPEDSAPGTYDYEIHLTKDTNVVTVALEEVSGGELNPEDYEFIIEANNGHLNHDNSLLNDLRRFVYSPWSLQNTTEEYDVDNDFDISRIGTTTRTSTVEAELTISRLVQNDWEEYTQPMLTINDRNSGQQVLSIPLIDYALKVRSRYGTTEDDQDYLDRQDQYNMTFFLDNGRWITNIIYINDWKIVLNVDDLQ